MRNIKPFGLLFIGWLLTAKAYAQELIPCADGTMADPSIGCASAPASTLHAETSISEIILKAASGLLMAVIVVAVLVMIYGGILYALAAGDDERTQKAKRTIFWSIVGLAISLLARMVIHVILGAIF